jgi:pimeloyl-ACP methyl ester carboxylesterase
VTEDWIEVGPRGLRLRVCAWDGPTNPASAPGGDRAPVVVLHGFLEQGAAWDRVATRLGRRVVAPDQRGHGRSDHVGAGGWYHFPDYVGDVDAVVRAIGGPVDLVGHSMGGTVAALFAGAVPEAVRRLVLVEGLGPPDSTEAAVHRMREYLRDRRTPPAHGLVKDVEDAARRMRKPNPGIPEEVARALAERTLRSSEGGLRWTWDELHRARAPTPFSVDLFRRFLAEIRCPVLLVDGGRSPFALPDDPERIAAFPSPPRRVVLPDAGHLVHHDDPEGLARVIREFLEHP